MITKHTSGHQTQIWGTFVVLRRIVGLKVRSSVVGVRVSGVFLEVQIHDFFLGYHRLCKRHTSAIWLCELSPTEMVQQLFVTFQFVFWVSSAILMGVEGPYCYYIFCHRSRHIKLERVTVVSGALYWAQELVYISSASILGHVLWDSQGGVRLGVLKTTIVIPLCSAPRKSFIQPA